jgi:nicotinate phosphoribosyltransferase
MARAESTSLLTDQYELTMVQAALHSGVADHRSVFEVFARRLPPGRRYAVACGLGRLLDLLQHFHFGPDELAFLDSRHILDRDTLSWLERFRFSGHIDAYAEGEIFFPGSPILTVEAPFAEAVILETLVLSVLNHDSAVASAAARMVTAACERGLVEMGGRRTHEEAAVAAARAAYIAGFTSTSNLEAARRYGIPTVGTAAHAFTLVHGDESAAFRAQVESFGPATTLLVDTFDIELGIRHAVAAAGPHLGAVRIDSGDLAAEASKARLLLDSLGATETRIVITSDLDEYAIEELATAPVDSYGVGTRLVSGSGAPTAQLVFKLVARADGSGADAALRPVAKFSMGKATVGGRKTAVRLFGDDGYASAELAVPDGHPMPDRTDGPSRPLQVRVMERGQVVHWPSLEETRKHHLAAPAELRPEWLLPDAGDAALITRSE